MGKTGKSMEVKPKRPKIVSVGKRMWKLPYSKLRVDERNLKLLLARIPIADRRLMERRKVLLRLAKDALGQSAARVYGTEASRKLKHNGNRFLSMVPWWNLGEGTHRISFRRSWLGYVLGFSPKQMLDCAMAHTQNVFHRHFPTPGQAFGPFVLTTLLHGWQPDGSDDGVVVECKEKVDIPIPLSKAYQGPDAGTRMHRATRASDVWEPGLVFDTQRNLFVPSEEAGPGAIDLEADE